MQLTRGIAFGGDYNPEQWPPDVWAEDVRLMQEAGVDLVTVGVFSWAMLQPGPGVFTFDWLDTVLDLMQQHEIGVDLATATASPPPWLSHAHPELLPMTADGRVLSPGGRQAFCPSSPIYREHADALVSALAARYARHPALRLWHVSNEMGGHNARCYCAVSAAAFRSWLHARYVNVSDLNAAWGTSFWSQRYSSFDEILPPRQAPTHSNPTQELDFARFSSDAVLSGFLAERDILHQHSPGVPVTTNFVVPDFNRIDYWAFAREVDLVANDHYLWSEDPDSHVDLAMSGDLTRSLAGGRPWVLMEHSTSAVNWQPRNLAKQPGQLLRNSLQHVAHGADGVLFFQWRASRAGAEKYHSALLPHAGTDTKIWRDSVRLSHTLDAIDEVRDSRVFARVAIMWDWHALWATELSSHPSIDVDYLDLVRRLYRPLWDHGMAVDFVSPDGDLSGYALVLVPALYLVTDAAADRIRGYVNGGGSLLVTFWSGIVDENDHVRLGGYPGAFTDILGIHTEEFFPLAAGQRVALDDGTTADVWTELLHADSAVVHTRYADGPLPGIPAVTQNRYGSGHAWYLATRLQADALNALVLRIASAAGVTEVADAPAGVETTRRHSAEHSYLFVINHTDLDAEVPALGIDLVTLGWCDGSVRVPAGEFAVIRETSGGSGSG